MKAEIISIGTELLLGEITDLNAAYLAGQLPLLGLDLHFISTVGDNRQRLVETLEQACKRSDIIITTGGLGPTEDDVTREAISDFLHEPISIDQSLVTQFKELFRRFKMDMPESNIKQASVIPSCEVIANPRGTAPGWWVNKNNHVIIAMPGPPGEMQPMWFKEVLPRLERKGGAVILSRTLKTWGLSEAKIDQLVGGFMSSANPTLALYAKFDGIQLRITAKAPDRDYASALISERESELRQILGSNVWGADRDTLEEVVSRLLGEKNLTLASAESFTGGLLSCSLANAPQSASFFKGGIIAGDEGMRTAWGMERGPSGQADLQSASRMAAVVRQKFAADIGIGIDGYIEPGSDAPTGRAFIAISLKPGDRNLAQTYPWRSNLLIRRAVTQALFSLRQALLETH